MKLTQAVAIGLMLVGLTVVPTAMLDFVRWGTIIAIMLFVGWRYLRSQSSRLPSDRGPAEVVAPLSAMLMVSVTAPIGRAFDDLERELFKIAIMRCVRGGDQVLEITPELYLIIQNNITPEMVEGIGQSFVDHLQDVLVIDDNGAIKQLKVGMGGVAPFSGDVDEGRKIAHENLKKLESMIVVNVLMSEALNGSYRACPQSCGEPKRVAGLARTEPDTSGRRRVTLPRPLEVRGLGRQSRHAFSYAARRPTATAENPGGGAEGPGRR